MPRWIRLSPRLLRRQRTKLADRAILPFEWGTIYQDIAVCMEPHVRIDTRLMLLGSCWMVWEQTEASVRGGPPPGFRPHVPPN